jgi:GxxExxY protein
MHANDTNNTNRALNEILYKDLSYAVTGVLFSTHNELGPYAREKQIGDLLEKKFKEMGVVFKREVRIGDSGNILDFLIEEKIILELKAVPFLIAEHYDQVKRYLIQTNLQLGLLVNFRAKRIQIKRVLNPNNL